MSALAARPLWYDPRVGETLLERQWLDVQRRTARAYDRRVRERFRLRAVRDEGDREEPDAEQSDYDAEVEREETAEKTFGIGSRLAAAAAAEAEGAVWSSYALRALQLGQPLREALRTASLGVAFDEAEDHDGAAAAEPPALSMTAAPRRAVVKKKERTTMATKRGERYERVIAAVRAGSATAKEVSAALGISGANASQALIKLLGKGILEREDGQYTLAVSSEPAAPRAIVKKPREAAHVARRHGGGSSDLASADPAVTALLEQRGRLEAQMARIDRALDVLQAE